jgi:hypothetical protein
MVLADPLTVRNRAHIVELAARSRIRRFIHSWSSRAWAGSWPTAPVSPSSSAAPAGYVEKILKGAKPPTCPWNSRPSSTS